MRNRQLSHSVSPRCATTSSHHAGSSGAPHDRHVDLPAQTALVAGQVSVAEQAVRLRQVSGGGPARTGDMLLQLQRWRGNRYVQQVVQSASRTAGAAPVIQPKLILGPATDRFEREADQVAERVVDAAPRSAAREVPDPAVRPPVLQRLTAAADGAVSDPGLPRAVEQARGGGQPLPLRVRGPMEQALGADFSGVRLHTDAEADRLNHALQARAFTTGQDIFFRRGDYAPHSPAGHRLLAHELTHVVQQRATPQAGTGRISRIQRKITVHKYSPQTDASGRPTAMSADVSGKPEKKGANPTSAGVWPKGYHKITNSYRLAAGDIFVKMHLLAGRLGGKNQENNLIPGGQSVNVGTLDSHNSRELEVYNYLRKAKGQGRVEIKAKVRYSTATDKNDGRYWWPKKLEWAASKHPTDASGKKWDGTDDDPIAFPSLEKQDDDYHPSAGEVDIEDIYGNEVI